MKSPAVVWTVRALACAWIGLMVVISPEVYADPEIDILPTIMALAILIIPAVGILKFYKTEK